jgi:phosphatidylserine/phosphatidylglycerophosphate/cardiolipin synthase-like enzyme
MRRNHRKLLIIDNRIAFVGGAGITDEYLTSPIKTDAKMNWHDIMLRVEGEVVLDWINSFCQVWQSISPQQVHIKDEKQDVTQFKQHGRVLLAQGPGHNQIIKSAIRNINRSQARVWIATPYFITTRKLRHALSRAAKRGVDVRLLLPGPISDHPWISQAARRYYKRLLHNGVKIFEYLPRFLHAKLILADDWISIGSSNLDRWNQFWNLDANQAINDHILLRQCESMFEVDFRQSQELRYAQWRKRPWSQRIAEWWSSYIVRTIHWVVYISARMRNKHTP